MLTKKEQKETIDVTIGRIRGLAKNLQSTRLQDLIDKVSEDLDRIRWPKERIIMGVDFGESINRLNSLSIRNSQKKE